MPVEIRKVLKVDDPTGHTFYLGSITPKQIKELTFVPVVVKSGDNLPNDNLNEDDTDGYQRAGETNRMKKIKEFFEQSEKAIIPPVLLSSRGQWDWKSTSGNYGNLQANGLAAIIDGQHRLGGLWRLVNDPGVRDELLERPIPFMLINDFESTEEKTSFIDINDNQKGVKKSLTKYLGRESNFFGQAATALMEDESSVFRDRIAIQKNNDSTLILFGAMQECINLLYPSSFIQTLDFRPDQNDETRTKCIEVTLEYWECVSQAWPKYWSDMEKLPRPGGSKSNDHPGRRGFEWRLLEETGIRAVSKLGGELLKRHWMPDQSSPSMPSLREDLEKIRDHEMVRTAMTKPARDPSILDKNPDLKSTGKAGVNAIYELLNTALLRSTR